MAACYPESPASLPGRSGKPGHDGQNHEKGGAEVFDWSYKTDCCGASSAVADKPVAINLIKNILDGAIEAGANAIVASCPMCQMNLDMFQDEAKIEKPLPIYFITELVGVALGLKSLMEKEIRRHFIDGVSLLKGLGVL